jgi:hypothetical protein
MDPGRLTTGIVQREPKPLRGPLLDRPGQFLGETIRLVGEGECPLHISRRQRFLGLDDEALDGREVLILIVRQLPLIDLLDQSLRAVDAPLRFALDALLVLELW